MLLVLRNNYSNITIKNEKEVLLLFEQFLVYSPVIIIVLYLILKSCLFRFSIFIDEQISSGKIKKFSHLLFWIIVSYIYWISNQYKILFVQLDKKELDLVALYSLILTIWASYGVYVGFLQFMVGYNNKENGAYLGYQKMDFLTKRNAWYHLTNSWEFFCSLLVSIIIPILFKINPNTNINYQYIWQAIIGFLLILFIFLLKFSLKVAQITIFINKKTDVGLKEVIESDIKNRYNKYLDSLVKKKFHSKAIESYFKQIKIELSNIENKKDQFLFLNIIYLNVDKFGLIDKLEKFEGKDITNYKYFIEKKYDLISKIDFEGDELLSFVSSMYQVDTYIFDILIKKSSSWIESERSFKSIPLSNTKSIYGVEVNNKIIEPMFDKYEINNIHIYMFKKLSELSKNGATFSQLVNLIQDNISQKYIDNLFWKIKGINDPDRLFQINKSISNSNLEISKENFKKIKRIVVYYSSNLYEIEFDSKNDMIDFSLSSNILRISFYFSEQEKCFVERNRVRDYYDEYKEEVWKILFNKYKVTDDFSDVSLPNLIEPEYRLDSFGNIYISDYYNKLGYSKICFDYLTESLSYEDSKSANNNNLLALVKTMSAKYRAAFALFQLLRPDSKNWDTNVEYYKEILSAVLKPYNNETERKEFYMDLVSIISKAKYVNYVKDEVLEKVFETKNVETIDDKFLEDFKSIPTLKLILVQNICSTQKYIFREVKLKERWKNAELMKQYLKGLSITPRIFSHDACNFDTLNSTMRYFLMENMGLLSTYMLGRLTLRSLLMFEELLHSIREDKSSDFEQKFMVDLFKKNNYSFSGSLLMFFTLKLPEGKGKYYLKLVNEKKFKSRFKFSLLSYLKENKFTLDTYLNEIENELNNDDSLMLGIYEKELIRIEIEKIIFQNQLT